MLSDEIESGRRGKGNEKQTISREKSSSNLAAESDEGGFQKVGKKGSSLVYSSAACRWRQS